MFWRYVSDHWQGRHGLAWSFWINFLLLRILLFILQEWINPQSGPGFVEYPWFVLGLTLVFHGLVFIWQAVGVLRAADRHIRGSGQMFLVWGAQLSLIIASLWVLSYGLESWHLTQPAVKNQPSEAATRAERAAKYSIEPAPQGRSLMLVGTLELGITAHLQDQLNAFPDVEQIVLTSTGGNIYEARGLANVIRKHRLTTLVVTECSSACTTVFIGGRNRKMGPDAKLGFHKYRIDADYVVLNADPQGEQDRDRAVFQKSGVADWFLEKMFDSDAAQMWYPEISELLDANVVTDILLPEGVD